jgi:hypothetical protein
MMAIGSDVSKNATKKTDKLESEHYGFKYQLAKGNCKAIFLLHFTEFDNTKLHA